MAELITLPSLNIRGMASSRIGNQASNVIPATATVTIDMRLVKGMDPRQTAERLIEHIRKQGFFVVDQEPSAEVRMGACEGGDGRASERGESAQRLSMDLPISQEVIRTVESARGPAVKIPNYGRDGCRTWREAVLGMRTIGFPSATTTTISTATTRICGCRICGTGSN